MPNNKVKTLSALQGSKSKAAAKKLHPDSRRAKQFNRVELRTKKLEKRGRERREQNQGIISRHVHLISQVPPEQTHFESLSDLHDLILGWVTRNDAELAEERLKRADRSSWDKKRAKSKNQERWDIEREQAEKEWREGFVIPDLTLPENVSQCRHWINALDADPAFLPRIRFIRLWEGNREEFRVEQEGIAGPGQKDGDGPGDRSKGGDDGTMEVDVSQMKEGKESVDWNKRRDSMMGMDDAPPPAVSGTPALVAAAAP